MTNAGGTPGGGGMFLAGLAMLAGGSYLLLAHVTVASGGWQIYGMNAFGLSLLPLLIGVGMLFFSGKSLIGWLLTFVGATIIFAGILMNMSIYFRPTSLFDTLVMLVLIAGGLGFIARSLKSMPAEKV
ncbi:MAG: hypothetical protein U0132_20400 [Gemmatimonadaceae bacterium]